MNRQLYEAAKVDGASEFQMLWSITLPAIRGTILIATVLRSMDAFRIFDKVYIMTGGGPGRSTEVLSMLIVKSTFQWFRVDYSAAIVSLLLIFLGVTYYFLITRLRWWRRQ
ncbi:Trehalose transport system permease protein SugA [subsurface metagenome]